MNKFAIAAGAALLGWAGAASAGTLTVTPTVASDYDWRGFSQTDPDQDGKLAYQLGATYAFDLGFYVGAWASNVDFGEGKPDYEVDGYVGYHGNTSAFGYDVGVNFYNYPGASDLSFYEGYVVLTRNWLEIKGWYSPKFMGDAGDDSAYYVELNTNFPLGYEGLSLLTHLGYRSGVGFRNALEEIYSDNFDKKTSMDYGAGVEYATSRYKATLKYVTPNYKEMDRKALILSVSTTLPWSE